MGVYIKGMEMPKNCGTCFMRVGGCKQRMYIEHRPKGCPLIELLPHGRLIDADALRLLYDFSGYKPTGDMTEEEFDRLMCRLPVIRAIIDMVKEQNGGRVMAQMPEAIILRKTEETKTGVTYCIADVKTNADRIRSMTDEELADWLFQAWHNSWYTLQEWLDWLKEVTDG